MRRSALRLVLGTAELSWTTALALFAADGAARHELDTGAAIALAESIPLLTVNLNNYKHPANPVLAPA